jgi:hypothetical protein
MSLRHRDLLARACLVPTMRVRERGDGTAAASDFFLQTLAS